MSHRNALISQRRDMRAIEVDLHQRRRAVTSRTAQAHLGRAHALLRAAIGEIDIALSAVPGQIVEHHPIQAATPASVQC